MDPLSDRITKANTLLKPYAVNHGGALGRAIEESQDNTRFPFQRDRDRIIHTQAFRRLKGKTQVFIAEKGDHYRTRLTHTMEVAQISRDMARTMGLNEDLAECIALAHDLGHTPFGHAGEDQMRKEMETRGGTFEHNLQSLRIVTLLENRTTKYNGLNLNREILEGMMKHRTAYDATHDEGIPRSPSLEAQVVNLADEIAYTAHDVDDGLRSDVLSHEHMMSIALYAEAHEKCSSGGTEVRGAIIHLLVMDAYEETERRLHDAAIRTVDDVYVSKTDLVGYSEEMIQKLRELRLYLYDHFYKSPAVLQYSEKGMAIIHSLFENYEKNPIQKILDLLQKKDDSLHSAVKDYIAGMTDAYAMQHATIPNT